MTFVLALLLAAAPTAAQLNTEGYRLYRAENYDAALVKFRAAIAADGKHALAHYNYAATLGHLRKQGRTCEVDAYQSTILEHLTRAVALDEGRRARMQEDADFDGVRHTLAYQRLAGREPERDADVPALLTALEFLARPQGAFGHPVELHLNADGTLSLTQLQVTDDDVKRVTLTGTWKASGRAVTLTLKQPVEGQTSLSATFTPAGHLVVSKPGWHLGSDRSDCDA